MKKRKATSALFAGVGKAAEPLCENCTHSLVERQAVLTVIRSCKEAISHEIARKPPRMSLVFDLKLKGCEPSNAAWGLLIVEEEGDQRPPLVLVGAALRMESDQ